MLGTVLLSVSAPSLGDPTWSRLKPSLGPRLPNARLQSRTSPKLQTHTDTCQLDIATRVSNRHLKLQCLKLNSSSLPPNLFFCRFLYSVYGNLILPTVWAPDLEASPTPIFFSHLMSDPRSILLAPPSPFILNLTTFQPLQRYYSSQSHHHLARITRIAS